MAAPAVRKRSALGSACEHALFAGARGAASRQQVRAAARAFVRRHRRDANYLAWVLRGVAASSALAIALLGFGAERAHASGPAPFAPLTGAANPLAGVSTGAVSFSRPAFGDLDRDGDIDLIAGEYDGTFTCFLWMGSFVEITNPTIDSQDVGFHSTPALGDLDGDGDLDLVAGESNGSFRYYENTGDAEAFAFAARTGAANPLNGQDVGMLSAPTLGDLDGDGDLDLVAGEYDGVFNYFENTGNATTAAFVARTGTANPLNGQDVGLDSTPALGDRDGDGDLDLVAGDYYGALFFFENTNEATSPAFVARTGTANPFTGQGVGGSASPAFADLDEDGDRDVVAGNSSGGFASFESMRGRFVVRTGATNPLAGVDLGYVSRSAFGDLDGDGDLDGIAGSSVGTFRYFQNTGTAKAPAFVERTGTSNPLNGHDIGLWSSPSLGDLDADGDLDLLAGEYDGAFYYFRNTGTPAAPLFVQLAGASNPADGEDVGKDSAPTLGDVDGDGDLDFVSGEFEGILNYYENTGTAASPGFAFRPVITNPPTPGGDVGYVSTPALGDVDSDGDLDLVAGEFDGVFNYWRNTGSATNPIFQLQTGAADPLRDQVVGYDSAPALADLDGDGDLDLVSGTYHGAFLHYESFVVQARLTAAEATGAANPLAGQDVGALSSPALADLDADGDPDLLVGEATGGFFYFRNTGSAIGAKYTPLTGALNPLNGRDVGDVAKPAFADVDADGDFDLVSGNSAGDSHFFENTGDARIPLFAAALVNPDGLQSVESDSSAPALGDLDGDGDLDLVAGEYAGFDYFENIGDATAPFFQKLTGANDPLDGETLSYASPAVGDFDRDGDLDLYAGAAGGRFTYFYNQGDASAERFIRRPAPVNPLESTDLGFDSAPAAADLDGDGDLDLVSGALDGTLHVHYFPEPARGWLVGAGAALIALLGRARRRQRR